MEQLPKKRVWLPSPGFLVFLGIIAVFVAIAIPGVLSSQRASNERTASTMLKILTSAEADFRANDRDGNKVNDFWTGDVSGLCYGRSPEGVELRLIEPTTANADARPLFPLTKGTVPLAGYSYQALERDNSVPGPEGVYKTDTDKSGRKVHHETKFGFCAFPKDGGSGKYVFFVNENNTIFRQATPQPIDAFPDDRTLKSSWSRID